MSGLYPTLEDLTVDQTARAQLEAGREVAQQQQQQQQHHHHPPQYAPQYPPQHPPQQQATSSQQVSVYSSLLEDIVVGDYLGIDVSDTAIVAHMPHEVAVQMQPQQQVALPGSQAIVSVTPKNDVGLRRAIIKQGVREIVLAKNQDGKLGIALKAMDKGVFVSFVWSKSGAALGGLRFGDQILQINGENVAGYSDSKAIKILKKAPADRVVLAIRDRPWCRNLTVVKDSLNHCGFTFSKGTINRIVVDSSAARNGLLINHRLIEINGQNVVGVADKAILEIIRAAPRSVTLTIMPTFIYDHLVKKIGSSTIKKYMDHGIPEL